MHAVRARAHEDQLHQRVAGAHGRDDHHRRVVPALFANHARALEGGVRNDVVGHLCELVAALGRRWEELGSGGSV